MNIRNRLDRAESAIARRPLSPPGVRTPTPPPASSAEVAAYVAAVTSALGADLPWLAAQGDSFADVSRLIAVGIDPGALAGFVGEVRSRGLHGVAL